MVSAPAPDAVRRPRRSAGDHGRPESAAPDVCVIVPTRNERGDIAPLIVGSSPLYPLFAILKNALFPGPGHVKSSGNSSNVATAGHHSAPCRAYMAVANWLQRDGVLLFISARTWRIALSVVRSGDPARMKPIWQIAFISRICLYHP
jgi:hypothetical protein